MIADLNKSQSFLTSSAHREVEKSTKKTGNIF